MDARAGCTAFTLACLDCHTAVIQPGGICWSGHRSSGMSFRVGQSRKDVLYQMHNKARFSVVLVFRIFAEIRSVIRQIHPCTISILPYFSSVVYCCCSHINSHNQVRGHRTGSSQSGAEEYPREKHKQTKGGTRLAQLTQFMPPSETYKSEIGSQSTMCQVHTGAYVSLLAPGKTDYTACHPRKTTT